ncbi:BCD family MFS transporter [Polymorphobacter sp. PAMC 29334]|uniref:BCD family MFS transporter n=1 Tax=Polymorphobacter sp. PAMC 29334 TaxID=2862331 RepID=UPI001D02694D|nr:BCD family MFS transporter [Polymorphobacter sp. PAMC 29334]
MTGLGWPSIIRLGLVQSAIGAIVVLMTSTLNRIMVVEYGLAATVPAGFVAWHYAVQLSRARWGHGSDGGSRRTPWIAGGMAVLAVGALLATVATTRLAGSPAFGVALAVVAFALIGVGVGAAGTSLLALLASRVAPARRAAAAAITWIMMIVGFIVTTAIAGKLLDPFSPDRLLAVVTGVVVIAFIVSLVGIVGIERRDAMPTSTRPAIPFAVALAEIWSDPQARRFTAFVAVSMLAYSAQELILEPFAGLLFGFTPGESTSLAALQHGGALVGMIAAGVAGNAFSGRAGWMRGWTIAGCIGSAAALGVLAFAATAGPAFPLRPTVFVLGLANGVFAVAAIGSMMGLAGGGGAGREGVRMGVWGAAQAIAFAVGGFVGAAGIDVGRRLFGSTPDAFVAVFAAEAAVFLIAAVLAARIDTQVSVRSPRLNPSFAKG